MLTQLGGFMFKRIMFFCAILLCVSCARRTIVESTASAANRSVSAIYNVLWANHSSDVGNSNVVSGRLPANGTLQSSALSGQVYANPVIFKDDNGTQYVLALVHTIDNELTVNCFTGDGSACEGFNSQTFDSKENFKHHQISVNIENNTPMVYVAHASGLSKFPAFGTGDIGYNTNNEPAYRLLIHNDNVFVQTESTLLKLSTINANLGPTTLINTLQSLTDNDSLLPLVISNEFIYVAHGKTFISKVDIDGIEQYTEEDFEDLPKEFDKKYRDAQSGSSGITLSNERVGFIAAYDGSIIFSIRYKQEIDSSDSDISGNDNVVLENQILSTAYGNADGSSLEGFYKKKFRNIDSKIRGLVGHPDMVGLPVDGNRLLLPGVPFSSLQDLLTNIPIQNVFTRWWDSPKSNSNNYGDPVFGLIDTSGSSVNHEHIYSFDIIDADGNAHKQYFNYVPKFLLSQGTDSYLTVLTQHPSHEHAIRMINTITEQMYSTDLTTNLNNLLSNSTTKVIIGGAQIDELDNKNISALSVGDGLVVMISDNSTIHFIQ